MKAISYSLYVNEARQNSPSEQASKCFQKLLPTFFEGFFG